MIDLKLKGSEMMEEVPEFSLLHHSNSQFINRPLIHNPLLESQRFKTLYFQLLDLIHLTRLLLRKQRLTA